MIMKTNVRIAITDALALAGGSIEDPSGHAPRILGERVNQSVENLYHTLVRMERDGLIKNERPTKRTCTRISLDVLPPGWPVPPLSVVSEEPSAPDIAPDPSSATEVNGEATGATPDEVATAILARVAEILSRPDSGSINTFLKQERDEMAARLSATLDENTRLRRERSQTGELVRAKNQEILGLRQRLQQAEANLRTVMRQGNAAVSHEVQREIAKFMREAPRAGT